MRKYLIAAFLTGAFALAGVYAVKMGTGAGGSPHVSVTTVADLKTPLPYPYDEHSDARADVAGTFDRAKSSGKRVLVDFGGNWCPDCRILAGVMELPEMQSFIAANYEVVKVDVGMFDKNLDVVKSLGVGKLKGVPTVVIAEPDGHPVNVTNSAELSNARTMTPQALADWLAKWAKPPK
jgi:thiol-disulfide isomerase/thioredoxin